MNKDYIEVVNTDPLFYTFINISPKNTNIAATTKLV